MTFAPVMFRPRLHPKSIMELPTNSGYLMADAEEQPQRKRARQACLACNARRVKCNVTERHPCDNCVAGNVTCETRESRRGKHPRPSKKRRDTNSTAGDQSQHADEVAGAHVLASLHRNRPSDGLGRELPGIASFTQPEQEISPRQDQRQEDDTDIFLGESNSLRYVPEEPKSASQPGPSSSMGVRLRHRVPPGVKAEALIPQWEVDRRASRLSYLTSNGAFTFPATNVLEGLLKAYFRWFHPTFAIVDEDDIWHEYRNGTLSRLLLQSMLFIGVLHCDERVLEELGYGTRHRAKYIFYNRAKDIYDAEYESKKMTVIQAIFLMSFFRAGAMLEKDTRHWLGCTITLAQTKALHRSAGKAEDRASKLRKRIWWSLYTRDRQCAAALGLPNRVRDEDCDFEPLEASDFEYAYGPAVPKKDAAEYANYAVAMTELATLLGKVVHSEYVPNKILSSSHRAQMRDELNQWKHRLPSAINPDNEQTPGLNASMQQLAYNNLLILLYRQAYIGTDYETREEDGNIVLQAAARNVRIVEDMLSDGNLRHGQIHVITNLFNTLCIHTVHLRRSEGTTRTVAEHRAKLCLLGLKELQKTWEVTNWVLQLFFQYLDRATAARLQVQGDENHSHNSASNDSSTSAIAQIASAVTETQMHPASADTPGTNRTPISLPQPETMQNAASDAALPGTTPWSWTSEEANQYLFNQIENEFAFGEGEIPDWNTDDATLNQDLFSHNGMGHHYGS